MAKKELTKEERLIIRSYKNALEEIRKEINFLYEKHAKEGKLSQSELSKYNRLTNLEKNIGKHLEEAYNIQIRITDKKIKDSYEGAFYYNIFNLEREIKLSIEFGLLKREAVKAVVEGPHKWKNIAKKNIRLTNAKIRNQIMQGVIQGKDVTQITKGISKEMNIAASKACRIVRTETHRVQNQGSLDSFIVAAEKGIIIQKVWVATLDERTRNSHRIMDGQIVDVCEEFVMPNNIKALAPGLSGSASDDINCRCIVVSEVIGFSPEFRRESKGIIPNQTYKDWAADRGVPFDESTANEIKKLIELRKNKK